jgi:hypothetical protein
MYTAARQAGRDQSYSVLDPSAASNPWAATYQGQGDISRQDYILVDHPHLG